MKRSLALALVCAPHYLLAQQLTGIAASRETVAVMEAVTLSLNMKVTSDLVWCGLHVDFGDGEKRDIRVDENPLLLTKAYARPGSYVVRADGQFVRRGLKSAFACLGNAQTITIVVADPAAEAMALAASNAARAQADALNKRLRDLAELESALQKAAAKLGTQAASPAASSLLKNKPVDKPTKLPPRASASAESASRPRDDSLNVFK